MKKEEKKKMEKKKCFCSKFVYNYLIFGSALIVKTNCTEECLMTTSKQASKEVSKEVSKQASKQSNKQTKVTDGLIDCYYSFWLIRVQLKLKWLVSKFRFDLLIL